VPDVAMLAGVLAPELGDPRLGGRVAGRVVDAGTGDVLFEQDADRTVVPASTAKLATGMAVEIAVEPGRRLTTRVRSGANPGEVVLVGGGDPTLSSSPTETVYAGAATLADLAAQVVAAAGAPVTGILVDSSLFTGPTTAPGWGEGDAPSRYAAPITATMVDAGRRGSLDQGVRSGVPDLDAGRALAAALGVPGVPVGAGMAPPGARLLGEVSSAPVERLVEQMLSLSDNVLAEALARQVALAAGEPLSFVGAAAAVRSTLERAGFDLSGAVLVDGSGLSTANRLSPALLSDILTAAASDPDSPGRALLAGLPVAAYDGTLVERFGQSPAGGVVRAKTGTLDGVSALAGIVETADGRLLVFALMADRVPFGGRFPAEAALDEAATALAGCGCST
jgi:D-alanyl-D-alanine carboxypeptidase/D-alanyl-D-alanine-endopeptidase (penicillin-binding protein 4)